MVASFLPMFVKRSLPFWSGVIAPSSVSSRMPSRIMEFSGGVIKGKSVISPRFRSSRVRITPAREERSISGAV